MDQDVQAGSVLKALFFKKSHAVMYSCNPGASTVRWEGVVGESARHWGPASLKYAEAETRKALPT